MDDKYDGLQEIIDEALESMAAEAGGKFDPQRCNLAEFCRRTGLSRQRARTIKANGFKVKPTPSNLVSRVVDDILREATAPIAPMSYAADMVGTAVQQHG